MTRSRSGCAVAALLTVLTGCASLQSSRLPVYTVEVSSGEFDRRGTPVPFTLPAGTAGEAIQLVDEKGRTIPVQRSGADQAIFILDSLPAGETQRFRLEPASAARMPPTVQANPAAGGVTFAISGQPVLRYNAEEAPLPRNGIDPVFRRGGYIHPVFTPSGTVVTGDYPADHLHHHGIWGAWTNTVFEGRKPDFWNMGARTGTVKPVALDTTWAGPVHGGFRARHRYVDLSGATPKDALNETWTVRVYDVGQGSARAYRLFDLEVVQTTASASPLLLPEYRYGGIGFRGHDDWYGEKNAFFLTSEGKTRVDGHATRARWAHVGGKVAGSFAGVGILAHTENFRFPEPMRIHPTEPFFNWAPSQAGDWSIQPGQPYVARYRYVVHDGAPDVSEINRLWNDFVHPPRVTVEPTSRLGSAK